MCKSILQQCSVRERYCPKDDPIYAQIEYLLNMCQGTHTSTDLYMQCSSSTDTLDDLHVDRLTLRSPIKIDDVQPAGPSVLPALRNLYRVGVVGGDLGVVSLVESYTATIFDID